MLTVSIRQGDAKGDCDSLASVAKRKTADMSAEDREILRRAMALLGRRSGAKLTLAQRRERAKKAAAVRWRKQSRSG
jgi:hypothetical protein